MLIDKYIDCMTDSQDKAQNPLSLAGKEMRLSAIKDMEATGVAVSTPYNVPVGAPDPLNQTHEWIASAVKFGLNVWLRQSWDDDEGWYGVPKQVTNNRITDTVNWIKTYNTRYPDDFKTVKFFTPKPEPQNMKIMGVNTGTLSDARFVNKAAFNTWLRDMMVECRLAFTNIGYPAMSLNKWGFDGFITCGYDNPDWSGKSQLEPVTVVAMGNAIAVDHYPGSKPMSDFVAVFKQTWPGVKFDISEYGTTQPVDKPTQLKNVLDTIKDDPMFGGFFSYWNLDGGPDVALLTNGAINPTGEMLKSYFGTITPLPPPPPPPTDEHKQILDAITKLSTAIDSRIILEQVKAVLWGTGTLSVKIAKLKLLIPNT